MLKKFFLLIVSAILFAPVIAFGQSADKSFNFDAFNADITVNEDSSILVEEELTINFHGSFSYFVREIPEQGEMRIENIAVYDDEGNKSIFNVENTTAGKAITVTFSAKDEAKTWIIQYKAKNAINFFSDYDELYWNVLPDDRAENIAEVNAIVHLPKSIADTRLFKQKIYSDVYGKTNTLDSFSVIDDQTLGFYGLNIAPHYNFTVVAGWPKNIVKQPAKYKIEASQTADIYIDGKNTNFQTPYSFWVGTDEIMTPREHEIVLKKFGYNEYVQKINVIEKQSNAINIKLKEKLWFTIAKLIIIISLILYILSPLLLFLWMLRKWFKTGRDPKGKETIIPQYEPYKNDTPGIMGTLIDEKADLLDITSTLVDLAVRGYVKIIENKDKKYSLKYLKEAGAELMGYERHLLEYIFADKKEVAMSDLSQKFYSHIKGLKDEMYLEVVNKKYFERNPQQVRRKYYILAIACLIFGAAGIFVLFLGIPLIIIGVILLIFSGRMPKRTICGVEALEWSLGFKMFLYHAERYRIAKMTPEFFEKCLPYAMVFKVEKEWAGHFADLYKQPPSWYEGYNGNNLGMWSIVGFTSSLSHSFAPALQTTLTSMPKASGSAGHGFSGFSGGGFSGGGFGGGGFHAG